MRLCALYYVFVARVRTSLASLAHSRAVVAGDIVGQAIALLQHDDWCVCATEREREREQATRLRDKAHEALRLVEEGLGRDHWLVGECVAAVAAQAQNKGEATMVF